MKLYSIFKGHKMGILSLLLVAIAAALGADCSFAMADATLATGRVAEEATNPSTPLTAANPDGSKTVGENDAKGFETVGTGAATATKASETGFAEEEIDKVIAQYDLFNFPFQWYIVNAARQVTVKTYTPKHYRNSSAKLDLETVASVTGTRSTTGDAFVITLTKNTHVSENFTALKQYSEVFFLKVPGYDPRSTTAIKKGFLAGYIIGTTANSASIQIVNPDPTATTLTIPANTKMFVGASAGSETQMIVPPDNYQPVKTSVSLQKKLSNIVWSKEWEEQAKEVSFVKEDLRNNALWLFKYKNAVTHWLGSDLVANMDLGGDLGEERVYFENGILNQINMSYVYDELDPKDFNAIAKLQFTRFSKNNHAVAFCGANFLEKMQNMNVSKVQVVTNNVEITGGLIVKRWESVFGKIDFVYDPILTEIGFSDFCAVFDMKEVTRYVKREQKTDSLDLSKTSEAREAKREMFSIIDCIALRGYNSVLVGPSDQMGLAMGLGSMETTITPMTSAQFGSAYASTTPADGTVIFLTEDYSSGDTTLKGEQFYVYDADSSTWKEYEGAL